MFTPVPLPLKSTNHSQHMSWSTYPHCILTALGIRDKSKTWSQSYWMQLGSKPGIRVQAFALHLDVTNSWKATIVVRWWACLPKPVYNFDDSDIRVALHVKHTSSDTHVFFTWNAFANAFSSPRWKTSIPRQPSAITEPPLTCLSLKSSPHGECWNHFPTDNSTNDHAIQLSKVS